MTQARWRIVDDQPHSQLTQQGVFIDGREIRFELLDTGGTGSVVVPLRNYTPEYVAVQVQDYADRMLAVSRLSNE